MGFAQSDHMIDNLGRDTAGAALRDGVLPGAPMLVGLGLQNCVFQESDPLASISHRGR